MSDEAGKIFGADRPNVAELLDALTAASGASRVAIDEQYTATVFVLERTRPDGMRQSVVVELVDSGPRAPADQRWTALAYDELRDQRTGTCSARTATAAIRSLRWSELDR
jgi:hypothetical protein